MDIRRTIISWSRSLSGRMLMSILIIHIVFLTALFYSILLLVENNYTEQFVDYVRTDSQRVSQLVSFELINNNQSELKQFSDNLLLGGQLVSIIINDSMGHVLYPVKDVLNIRNNQHEDFFFGENGDNLYYIKTRLTTKEGIKIGTVHLAYDERPTNEAVADLYQNGLFITSSYLFIFLIFIGVIDTYLTQPLRDLTSDANRIASGKYKEKFAINTNLNEVKFLTDSLELMRNELVNRGEKLADREKRIRALVNSITDVVIVCDLNGKLESVNQAITFITDYTMRELEQEHIGRLIDFNEVLLCITNPLTDNLYETVALTKSGESIPVEVNVSELQQGSDYLLLVLLRDIRERKRNEMGRYQYHNDMAHAGRLGIMGEMAAGIAHELNQPLAAISLYLQGCIRRCESHDLNKQKVLYAIRAADEQAMRAAGIIRRIKGFVRKETEHDNLEVVDTNQLIKRSVEFVMLDKKYSNIQPELLLTSQVLNAKVDSLQIEQVLVNLIRNAIEAILLKKMEPYFLKIYSNINKEGFIKVCVVDSGCGVEVNNVDKIFDTYFTTKKDGLGMGLAICRSIIEQHDGVLQFSPGVETGSEFYFTLPFHNI